MFALDRDTAMLVAVVACIAATAYLFMELRKTRVELSEKQRPVMYMNPPSSIMAAPLEPEEEPVPAPVQAPPTPPVAPPSKPTTRKKQVSITEPESSE